MINTHYITESFEKTYFKFIYSPSESILVQCHISIPSENVKKPQALTFSGGIEM